MATRTDFKSSRSNTRESRQILRDFADRQTNYLEKDYFITSVLFRSFFLLGSLILIMSRSEHILSAIPIFFITMLIWIYRSVANHRQNSLAIRRTERILFDQRFDRNSDSNSDNFHNSSENDDIMIDNLIRMQSARSDSLFAYSIEPVFLFFGIVSLAAIRLDVIKYII